MCSVNAPNIRFLRVHYITLQYFDVMSGSLVCYTPTSKIYMTSLTAIFDDKGTERAPAYAHAHDSHQIIHAPTFLRLDSSPILKSSAFKRVKCTLSLSLKKNLL